MNTNIPVFIIHYKKLTERKEYLNKTLTDHGFTNIHWFEDIDRDTLTQEQINMYQYDENQWMSLNAVWKHTESKPRPLNGPEIACTLTHIDIYKYILTNNILKALVLEDDVILKLNFKEDFEKIIKEIEEIEAGPGSFDMCFLNDAFGWTIDNFKEDYLGSLNKNTYTKDKHIYRMYSSRCSDSYIISNSGAKTLYTNIIPFCLPIDWMQTPIIIKNDMKVYWTEPSVTHQGSEDVYKSSMERPRIKEVLEEREREKEKEMEEQNIEELSALEELKIFSYRKFNEEVQDSTYNYLQEFSKDRLEEFETNINSFKNFIVVKFGDGEMRNMTSMNETDHNCDGCFYYKNLGFDLIKSYIYFLKRNNAYISKWHSHTYTIQKEIEKDYTECFNDKRKFVYYDLLVHKLEYNDGHSITFKPEQISFFRIIKESTRFKIYVSNIDMINALAPILKLNFGLSIPIVNSYLHKDEILNIIDESIVNIKTHLGVQEEIKDFIFLFSGGMFAKVLIFELSKKYPKNTFIDIGSTFDGLIKRSRDFNGTVKYKEELLKYYA